MDPKSKAAADEIRKMLDETVKQKKEATDKEEDSWKFIKLIKDSLNVVVAENLKPAFEERGKSLQIIFPEKSNLIEVLYYPQIKLKETTGVNTAALRIEFLPKDGIAQVFKRESFYSPFTKVGQVVITDQKSIETLTDATIDFAKGLAVN